MNTGTQMDALVAEALGYQFWREKRGESDLSVMTRPGDEEPWKNTQSRFQTPERHRKTTGQDAFKAGFYGVGPKAYSRDLGDTMEVIEHLAGISCDYTVEVAGKNVRVEWNGFSSDGLSIPEAFCRVLLAYKNLLSHER